MFDKNEVMVSGKVLAVDGGLDERNRPYANLYLESVGKKYPETVHFSFSGENAERLQKEVSKDDSIIVFGSVNGKKVIDSISIRLHGYHFFLLK